MTLCFDKVHGRVFGLAEDEVSSFADNDEEEEGKGKGNEEDKGNEEEGEEGEENDLVDIAPGSSRPRRVIGTVLLLTAIALLLLAYLVRYPPPFLQRLASSPILTLKRLSPPRILNRLNAIGPFRVREARLVRWAQEDMGLLGGELGEEDVMVNGADAGDELDIDGGKGMGKGKGGGVGKGEQIPLKPTPWAGVRGYGTAAR
ncbi:hypothetical protein PLICRDRAFT_46792 [Plicaturopsis crispa FD-325 SS-3]|uniref:Uncharacterized protein n=1 Tax=Plicaturopsis crispa FD-325 SS-3 TaxID=944288 RepID=A0A0C9SKM6_PLICR|nr:hypothetical protein PLICRDRAFT_46792 [Plicaturopsis crispa FD-325 SS-3]